MRQQAKLLRSDGDRQDCRLRRPAVGAAAAAGVGCRLRRLFQPAACCGRCCGGWCGLLRVAACDNCYGPPKFNLDSLSSLCVKQRHHCNSSHVSVLKLFSSSMKQCQTLNHVACFAISRESEKSDKNVHQKDNSRPKKTTKLKITKGSDDVGKESSETFPTTIPKKPRRGRRSEAAAVEDFVRDKLEQTFASIREQNSDIMKDKGSIMKDSVVESHDTDSSSDEDEDDVDTETGKKMLVEEEDPDWPLDADVGWGVRASEYFEKHPIKNTVGEDGVVVNWEGELDDCLVKEITCLEWENASKNWKVLKELEKAALVYWKAKDRLPPRTVKIDINIERDLAYALDVKECPEILFLRGNKIVHREKDMRTADELVQMIAHFYYNAKRPACINNLDASPPF
nr:thioredoxin-like fold domain-containing protein MRL7, chloroplastic [Ipomoea batatas]